MSTKLYREALKRLERTDDAKLAIADAIRLQGVAVPEDLPFREYSDKIGEIRAANVLFYDWDDTPIGAMTVPVGIPDIRALVNAYVRDKLVHPDIRQQTATELASLDRINTYRGEFPADGPEGTITVTDGADYPLTNKLEYVFYGKTRDADYPYVSGWVQVTPETMADTWTTLEAGGTIEAYDFSGGVTGDVLRVKAAYVPGTWLDAQGSGSYATRRFYSFSNFNYVRIDTSNYQMLFDICRYNAEKYGVTRVKNIGIRINNKINETSWNQLEVSGGEDSARFTLFTPAIYTSFTMGLVILEPGVSFLGGTALTNIVTFYPTTPNDYGLGYITEAVFHYLNTTSAQNISNLINTGATFAPWLSLAFAAARDQLSLTQLVADIVNQVAVGTSDLNRWNIAKNRITMYRAGIGNRDLSYDEVHAAVAMNPGNDLINTGSAAYLVFRVQTMTRAYELNAGDLTVPQMLALIAALNVKGSALTDAEIMEVIG